MGIANRSGLLSKYKLTGSTFASLQHRIGTCFLSHKWEDDVSH